MAGIERTASAVWEGSVARGAGALSTESGALAGLPYSLASRTSAEPTAETNPEELLAAAHAGCFAMALATQLAKRQAPPERLEVRATVVLDKVDDANRIVASTLHVGLADPPADALVDEAVVEADARCPFSALIRDAGGTVTVERDAR